MLGSVDRNSKPSPPSALGRRRARALRRAVGLIALLTLSVIVASATWAAIGTRPAVHSGPAASDSSVSVAAASASLSTQASESPSTLPSPSPSPSSSLAPTPSPSPTSSPPPVRKAVNVNIESHPRAVFRTEVLKTWCAAAAVQMTLNVIGPTIDISTARQKQIHLLEVALTTRADSRDGGVGPLGMVATLNRLGTVRYELRVYRTRAAALRDTARAISATRHPVILMAWYGAHAWVMTGYRADADPTVFADANVQGAYILDAWYPRVSSIWGPSDPPGTYQNGAEMRRNYLPYKRPEAHYPGWDGRFLALVPAAAPSR